MSKKRIIEIVVALVVLVGAGVLTHVLTNKLDEQQAAKAEQQAEGDEDAA